MNLVKYGSILLFLLFLAFTFPQLTAQPTFDHITIEDGLLNNYINCIYQDRQGFIWIGTKEGLTRYDGYQFLEFTHDPQQPNSLSNNVVSDILADSYGKLWVATTSGLNLFLNEQEGFHRYYGADQDSTSLSYSHISQLYEDSDKNLWVGTGDGGLHLYHRENDDFSRFPATGKAEVRAITEDRNGLLVVGYGAWVLRQKKGGVRFFDRNSKRYVPDALDTLSEGLSVTALLSDEHDNVWIATYNDGFYQYPKREKKLISYQAEPATPARLHSNLIYSMIEARDGTIWIGTDGGSISLFEKESNTFSQLDTNNGLNSKAITYIFEDRTGIMWIGTVNGGINRLDKHKSSIEHLAYDKGNPTGLSGKSVLALCESRDGGIWMGLDHGGLNYYDRKSQHFRHYLYNPKNALGVGDNVINGVYEARNGDLFIGYYLNGFGILDSKRKKFTHYGNNNALHGATYIKCFFEDSSGIIWMGSRNQGLIRFDRETGGSSHYKHEPGNKNTLTHNHVSTILEEDDHSLWVGTFNGFGLFDKEKEIFTSWVHNPADPESLSGIQVYSLYKDKQGRLWIGTDNGLNYFDRENQTFKHYTVSDGLPSNTIKGILKDDDNHLWIATNRGISRFSIDNKAFKNYGFQDGIRGLEFNENATLKTSDGKLMFGSVNGVSSFYPSDIKSNPIIPPVVITNFLIANKPVKIGESHSPLQKHISQTQAMTLTHQHTVFTFEFVALNYTSPEKNQYAYKLEGFDEDWNYVGGQRNATYTNIDPGAYTFKVKASNNDGSWNEEGASVNIRILPPWWKTWWAYSLYLVVLILATIGVSKASLNRLKLLNALKIERLEKQKQHELNQLKLSFFTNISHEFKTPLTLILGPLEKLMALGDGDAMMKKQFHLMQRNANRLLRLINQLMSFRKADQGKMILCAGKSDIIPFINYILESFTEIAREKKIEIHRNFQFENCPLWFDAEKLDIVLYNLLSNAIKFTKEGGQITLSVTSADKLPMNEEDDHLNYIAIAVEDTGSGIPPDKLDKIFERFYQVKQEGVGTGIGLSLSKSLIALHHGELLVYSEPGKGSKFIIRLPQGNKHLTDTEIVPTGVTVKPTETELPASPTLTMEQTISLKHDEIRPATTFTLLIVEDEPGVKEFLRDSLAPAYRIKEASNGWEGLQIADKSQPDLIISDVMMPEMNGITFCKQIKTDLKTSHIPVILLTARSAEENMVEGLETGADDYVTKPFSLRVLEARIKNLIEGRQKLKERFKREIITEPGELTITSVDEKFLIRAVEIVEKNMADPEFNVDGLLKEIGMSRSPFFRKIKALSGQSPHEFIQTLRLKKAAQLLLKSGQNVSEVAYDMGFGTVKNFRICFKKHFNQTPTEFVKSHNEVLSNH